MSALREVYQCAHCGLVVEVVKGAGPKPVCCGEAMQLLGAKTEDAGQEKHVPVTEDTANGIKVKVGDVQHPMADDHYIQFIEVVTKTQVLRTELNPGEVPEAEFLVNKEDVVEVREYCTTHGLWKA